MARGQNTEATNQAKIMALWLSGSTHVEIAEQCGLSRTTVTTIINSELFVRFRHLKKGTHEAQVWRLLSKLLGNLEQMTAYLATPEYLEKQEARSAAILAGVLYDKAFRLLQAKGQENAETERILAELALGSEPEDIEGAEPPDWGDVADTSEAGTKAVLKVAGMDKEA